MNHELVFHTEGKGMFQQNPPRDWLTSDSVPETSELVGLPAC